MTKQKFISIQQAIKQKTGKVSIRGWIYRERGSNKFKFLVLRDSTNIIQCILDKERFPEQWEQIDKLQMEASVQIEGSIQEEPRAPTGYEIHATKITIVGESNEFPINKDLNEELLGDRRHLWIRSRKMVAMLKIRDTILSAMREHWRKKGFYEYHSPSLLGLQCEGGSTLFKVDYFGKPLFLSQSWQLHAEPGIFALEKIFTIQPSFRAEKSKTSRHLTEFWHAEMEVAWENFEYLQNDAEELIKHIVSKVLEKNKTELETLKRDPEKLKPVLKKPFPRMTYSKALEILKEKCNLNVEWGKDLRTIEEDKLSELYDTPIIVTHYPKEIKAFYMKESPDNPNEVLGFDMIAPEHYGELIGASQREESIEKLTKRLKAQGEDPEKYDFYFDTRRYGSVPHGGYGMGVERVIAWIIGAETIKDTMPFPRTMTRFVP
ncbi:MAG: asparagine--tRNA ligase [Nanoarchaeota archaeon]